LISSKLREVVIFSTFENYAPEINQANGPLAAVVLRSRCKSTLALNRYFKQGGFQKAPRLSNAITVTNYLCQLQGLTLFTMQLPVKLKRGLQVYLNPSLVQ